MLFSFFTLGSHHCTAIVPAVLCGAPAGDPPETRHQPPVERGRSGGDHTTGLDIVSRVNRPNENGMA